MNRSNFDELLCDIYDGNIWKTVWIDSAVTVSDKFVQVLIPIRANFYLHSGFQFRFQSYGRQSGQFDVWHLDYVYLDGIKNIIKSGEILRNCDEPLTEHVGHGSAKQKSRKGD